MTELTGKVGFVSPIAGKTRTGQRTAGVELIATAALAVSLVIAATAVSIGMTRTQALGTISFGNGSDQPKLQRLGLG